MRFPRLDYARYLVRSQRAVTIILVTDVALFTLAGAVFTQDVRTSGLAQGLLSLVVLGIAAFRLLWSLYKLRMSFRTYFHESQTRLIPRLTLTQPFGLVNLDNILPSSDEANAGFQQLTIGQNEGFGPFEIGKDAAKRAVVINKEHVFRSTVLDEFLWEGKRLPIEMKGDKPARVQLLISRNRPLLLKVLNRHYTQAKGKKGVFFNEAKLCLSHRVDPGCPVECHRGTYFDSVLTNEACTKLLASEDGNDLVADLTHMFPVQHDGQGRAYLEDVDTSAMNDHIGVSTLGFTEDHYLVLWEQAQGQQSHLLLAPTGSGSCDFKDLDASDFCRTLCRAMERELCEESGRKGLRMGPAVIQKTMILGFYRWLRRGGKPEFAGITRLKVKRGGMQPNPAETSKPLNNRKNTFKVAKIEDLPSVLNEMRQGGGLSLPLAMNLLCLEHVYHTRRALLDEFLFEPGLNSRNPEDPVEQ
jgi:hypothetical protein